MRPEDRYDSLIRYWWEQVAARRGWDDSADWRLFKALIRQESAFNPAAQNAVSGALGLAQLMADVDLAIDGQRNGDNPERAIYEGLLVLGDKWGIFAAERGFERWRFALGAYNGGEGWVIKAQKLLARRGQPTDRWELIASVLHEVKAPHHARETCDYVARISADFLAQRGAAQIMGEPA